jgi:hypothetical protein
MLLISTLNKYAATIHCAFIAHKAVASFLILLHLSRVLNLVLEFEIFIIVLILVY